MKINNSTPAVINNVQNNQKKVAFGSNSNGLVTRGTDFLKKTFVQERQGNLSRGLFILTAFTFLLGSRLVTSRDNNERRETLTRDVPTFIIAVQGVPVIGNFIAKKMQKSKGFALIEDIKAKDIELAKNTQLKDWYQYDNHLNTGFEGFVKRLSDVGANLKKVCSSLNDDVKAKIANFSEDNAKFIDELSKDKTLKQTLETEFGKEGNNALKKASFLKVIPKLAGFLITLVTIGIFIPEFNIFLTESINKNKARKEEKEEKEEAKKA